MYLVVRMTLVVPFAENSGTFKISGTLRMKLVVLVNLVVLFA